VGKRIFPAIPQEDTQLPFVVYYESGSENPVNLNAPCPVTNSTVTIDIVARHLDEAQPVATVVAGLLNGWRSMPTIQGCFGLTQSNEPQTADSGPWFMLTQTYQVWHA
jgi:hypothetical protein